MSRRPFEIRSAFWASPQVLVGMAIFIFGVGGVYVLSVPCISMFMRVARQRHPKAMVLASSVEPTAFNIGISFGTAVGSAVVAGPVWRALARWAPSSRWWHARLRC